MVWKDKDYEKEYRKKYYEKNKEKRKEYYKTPKGKKSMIIGSWKSNGLKINDDIDEIYERYINSIKCELCGLTYTDKNVRCMDHDHHTGLFRNVICKKCNCSSKLKTNQNKNIHLTKFGTWKCRIIVNKINYDKTFKTKSEAIKFRDFLM